MKTNNAKKKVGARSKHAPTKERPPVTKARSLSRLRPDCQKSGLKVKPQSRSESLELNKTHAALLRILAKIMGLYKIQIEAVTVEEVTVKFKQKEQAEQNEAERAQIVKKIDAWSELCRCDDEWYKNRFERRSFSASFN